MRTLRNAVQRADEPPPQLPSASPAQTSARAARTGKAIRTAKLCSASAVLAIADLPIERPSSRCSSAASCQTGCVVEQCVAYEVADIEFDAEGVALRGWLYRPRSSASAAPVVVMAHGYNCLKEFYLDKYAASIASA